MRYSKCAACYGSVGWIGLLTNTVLMVLKAFVGLVSGSQALVADAMYSAKDIMTSLLVIVGLKVSGKPLDREHPYGHGKIEFILSLVLSVCFLVLTGFLFVYALQTLLDDSVHSPPHLIALWTALISIGVNVFMYYFSRCVTIELNSPMVRTLAKHHHADATSSGAVAIGIIGAHYMNMPWIDTLVALFETMHLLYLGGDVFWDSYKGLMDRSTSRPLRDRITRAVTAVDGVKTLKDLRTRHVGQVVCGEIVIGVDAEISVEEAHGISADVQSKVSNSIPHLGELQVRFETHGDGASGAELQRESG